MGTPGEKSECLESVVDDGDNKLGAAAVPPSAVQTRRSAAPRLFFNLTEPLEPVPGPSGLQTRWSYSTSAQHTAFKCDQCKKHFSSKFKLVRHALIHSDRKAFSCHLCERSFHRKDHLANHIKVHSSVKKLYACDKHDCGKEYTSIMSYRKHLALHAAQEGGLQCQVCLSSFENKEQILHHLKVHAGSRALKKPLERKFKCDQCDRRFFTRKDVRRHSVVHTGMRDFLCQFCPHRFGRKDHLVRHIRKSHAHKSALSTGIVTATATPFMASPSGSSTSESIPFALSDPAIMVPTVTTPPLEFDPVFVTSRLKLEHISDIEVDEFEGKEEMEDSGDSGHMHEFKAEQHHAEDQPYGEYEQLHTKPYSSLLDEVPYADEQLHDILACTAGPSELKDLGGAILEHIGIPSCDIDNGKGELRPLPQFSSELHRLLTSDSIKSEPSTSTQGQTHEDPPEVEETRPLPGFSQTFQTPPPPPPPPSKPPPTQPPHR